MYKYLFGPVPSRRLGMSLGVDLVPKKVCTLDCVYCEVGKTTLLTAERKPYILYEKVVAELAHYFENSPLPDYITFSGSGEPTLNSRLGDVLGYIKQKQPNVPVAVLTNGTLLYDEQVRQELLQADLVLPSLDAATSAVFEKINRPAAQLTVQKHIQGLIDFAREFGGRIWLEIFVLPHYNYTNAELLKMKDIIEQIEPESVQLNTLDRPGTEDGLVAATHSQLERIQELWQAENVKIIAAAPKRKQNKSYRKDAENAILGTITRRPCTANDMVEILGMHINELNKYLDVLEAEGKITTLRQKRGVFYQAV